MKKIGIILLRLGFCIIAIPWAVIGFIYSVLMLLIGGLISFIITGEGANHEREWWLFNKLEETYDYIRDL